MSLEAAIVAALRTLPDKPSDSAPPSSKKAYSEKMSAAVAMALGAELRSRGCREARPAGQGELGDSGAERRMAGGIGAKKVDVTWATEESGLLLAVSVKTVNFKDAKTGNYQKNLTNRRGDMLMEAVTLHRRFPYAVLIGLFFLDARARTDGKAEGQQRQRRKSTTINAHQRLKLFTGRNDPRGRDEQYERFYLLHVQASPENASVLAHAVGEPDTPVGLASILDEALRLVAERNPDFYDYDDDTGCLVRT